MRTTLTLLTMLALTTTAWGTASPESDSAAAVDDRLGEPTAEQVALRTLFGQMPDPQVWSVDATSGLHYRRATLDERLANDWKPGTFLVESGSLTDLQHGVERAHVLVPTADAVAALVDLSLRASRTGHGYAATYAGPDDGPKPDPEYAIPQFYYYEAVADIAADSISGKLTAADDGGYYGQLYVGNLTAEVESTEKWWTLETIPTPSGAHVDPAHLSLVILSPMSLSGFVYGGDLGSDDDSFSTLAVTQYDFALMGEIKWCTRYESSWKSKIDTLGAQVDQGFANNGGTNADLGMKHDHCWIANSMTDAENCANNGGCSDSSGHAYPYNGDADDAEDYRDHVWNDVSHSRLHWSFEPLKIAQAIHDGPTLRDAGYYVCGTSQGYPGNGGSVAAGLTLPDGCLPHLSTHEIGHNFDADHDNNLNANGCRTVMGQSKDATCRDNYFSTYSKGQVNNCVTLADCPRSGTG